MIIPESPIRFEDRPPHYVRLIGAVAELRAACKDAGLGFPKAIVLGRDGRIMDSLDALFQPSHSSGLVELYVLGVLIELRP